MSSDTDVLKRITLKPDPNLVSSLGTNHTLASAIADLVDNSIDAGASAVAVRLLTQEGRLAQVEIVDDGCGMDQTTIDEALVLGKQRSYSPEDLGHFGIGLKAAAFGQADVLTVGSKSETGAPVGRRIRRANFAKDFSCEVLTQSWAQRAARSRKNLLGSAAGTTVTLSAIRNFYHGTSESQASDWLENVSAEVRCHLATTFHRLLESGRVGITLLVDETNSSSGTQGVPLLPIDPFCYSAAGYPGYPKVLHAESDGESFDLKCHIWPGKTDITGFRIGSKRGESLQGFYCYRRNRLLQIGGWSNAAKAARHLQLARVEIHDESALGHFTTLNPEKNGLRFDARFHDALNNATASDGTTFAQFLSEAEIAYRDATKRVRRRNPVIQPGKGFDPALRKSIEGEFTFLSGDPMNVKWGRVPAGDFMRVDFEERTLWLNTNYRHLFAGPRGSLNDAPMLKALLYLLTHELFEGQHLGARDKDNILLWKGVLKSAIEAELSIAERQS